MKQKAEITKAAIVLDKKEQPNLIAVAEYGDEMLNIRIAYDWENLNRTEFEHQLRNQIAVDLDIPTSLVEVDFNELYRRMLTHYLFTKDGAYESA